MLQSQIFKRTLSHYTSQSITSDIKAVNDLIYNEKKHLVAIFKDFLILNESCDFFSNYYPLLESLDILTKLLFCERNTILKPNYTSLLPILSIMNKNLYRKEKVLKILEMEEDKMITGKQVDDISEQNEKMINSSLVAESLAISQYSERALFLNDKDKAKGCLDFMERNEVNHLFYNANDINNNSKKREKDKEKDTREHINTCNKIFSKYEKNQRLQKHKRNTKYNGNNSSSNNNNNDNNTVTASNKAITPIKTINQLVGVLNKRNKALSSSQGFQFKSIRKTSLTLDNHCSDNDANINQILHSKGYNTHANNHRKPISVRYESQMNSKLSTKTNANGNVKMTKAKSININLNPTIVNKAMRNSINNKLKKCKTFSLNETMEALLLIQKEKQLLQNRMKKQSSPTSIPHKTQKFSNNATNSIKPTIKKNLKIDTVMQLSHNQKTKKQHLSMMKLYPTTHNSKSIAISTFNSTTVSSRLCGQLNSKPTSTKASSHHHTQTNTNTNTINNSSKITPSHKVSITLNTINTIQQCKHKSQSVSKEKTHLNKRNSSNCNSSQQFKLLTVETMNNKKMVNDAKKKHICNSISVSVSNSNVNHSSVGSDRRSKTMAGDRVKSSSSFLKNNGIKLIVNVMKRKKGVSSLSSITNNTNNNIKGTTTHNAYLNTKSSQLKKNSLVALKKSSIKNGVYKSN